MENTTYKYPIEKTHKVGESMVITLHPSHIKRLNIDAWTFFSQEPIENGILLRVMNLKFGIDNNGK